MERVACIAFALGCPRARIDVALVKRYFGANGWRVTNRMRGADLILVNTCGFDVHREERSVQNLRIALRRAKPGARVIVLGCLAGINAPRLRDDLGCLPISPQNLEQLDEVIGATVKLKDVPDPNIFAPDIEEFSKSFSRLDTRLAKLRCMESFRESLWRRLWLGQGPPPLDQRYSNVFNIRVAKGCASTCSFCAIRFASGPLISKPLNAILEEFDRGRAAGHRAFYLIAGDVGCWGQDIGQSICDLLEGVFDRPGEFRVLWEDFSPRWLIQYYDTLSNLLARNARRIGHLGMIMQAGSEKILRLMDRGYGARESVEAVSALSLKAPAIDLSTHVMVGFPGETEEDFLATVSMLRAIPFKRVQAFKHSDRPGTAAAALPNKVPEKIKSQRQAILRRMFRETCAI